MNLISLLEVADISQAAGTDMYLFLPPYAGKIQVDASFLAWTEATGSQTSAQGVVSLKVGGNEVGTITAAQSASIGATQPFVVDGTYATAANPFVEFSAGDAILLEIGTQASGGTVTGDGDVYLSVEFGV